MNTSIDEIIADFPRRKKRAADLSWGDKNGPGYPYTFEGGAEWAYDWLMGQLKIKAVHKAIRSLDGSKARNTKHI